MEYLGYKLFLPRHLVWIFQKCSANLILLSSVLWWKKRKTQNLKHGFSNDLLVAPIWISAFPSWPWIVRPADPGLPCGWPKFREHVLCKCRRTVVPKFIILTGSRFQWHMSGFFPTARKSSRIINYSLPSNVCLKIRADNQNSKCRFRVYQLSSTGGKMYCFHNTSYEAEISI